MAERTSVWQLVGRDPPANVFGRLRGGGSTMIVEREYLDHWKIILLKSLTRRADAAEFPLRLWSYCEARMDDYIEDVDGAIIPAVCRWNAKEPHKLVNALIECRWIERKDDGYLVRGWRERQKGRFASILNGKKGGRPKSSQVSGSEPASADRQTNAEPARTPQVSKTPVVRDVQASKQRRKQNLRAERRGEESGVKDRRGDESGGENTPPTHAPPKRNAVARASVCDANEGRSEILTRTIEFITGLFGKKRNRLAKVAELELGRFADQLPLTPEQETLLRWFYGLPLDSNDFHLERRSSSPESLARSLFAQLAAAEKYAKKTGATPHSRAEPEGWRELHAKRWPQVPIQARFVDLEDTVRAELTKELLERGRPAASGAQT